MKQYKALRTDAVTELERKGMERVRALAGQCMVLMENNGALPLKGVGKIALYGNGARATVKGGTGSGDVNSRFVVNVEQGLEEAGFTVTTKNWLDAQDKVAAEDHADYMRRLEEEAAKQGMSPVFMTMSVPYIPKSIAPLTVEQIAASDTDTAIYVLARNSGEGQDRFNEPGDYMLLDEEKSLLTLLGENYKNVIVLLNIGGVIDAPAIRDIPGISSVVLMSQAGNVSGQVVSDLLLGKVYPYGRLTDTWAEKYSDYPCADTFSHNNGDWHDEYYNDGIYVGYRYFDTFNVTPAYPFGYGMSYTSFDIDTTAVEVKGGCVSVTVKVTNTGEYKGREVVQIYGSAPSGEVEKPWQVLAAFAKTRELAPSEKQEMTLTFPLRNLESYDKEKAAYVLEAGIYYIRVGSNSRSTRIAAAVTLDKTVETKKVKNICPLDTELKLLSSKGVTPYGYEDEEKEKAAAVKLTVCADDIPCEEVKYSGVPQTLDTADVDDTITIADVMSGKYTMEQLVSQLSVPEMAVLCVGASRDGEQGAEEVIGNAGMFVPGAAGDTTSLLEDSRGVRDMVNADGPAGLRLKPHFRVDASGRLVHGGDVINGMEVSPMPEKKDGDIDYYQYCTAIPIAWLLASSWDMELVEEMGDIVGGEMEQFGVQVWLAPGMNIHRNPLCGRNFEYFSEDPLLSGLCAAADTVGIQKHHGVGTCIKHFFANNLEDNRFFNNSHIDEQAAREIYLRNFAVAIEAAQPMCIMTSYNLINGVHTANSYDIITAYAREECGFKGYVMTDWLTSHPVMAPMFAKSEPKYPYSSSPECVRAGNDVQMPGCQQNVDDIIAAVEDGTLPIGCLQQCALRILKTDIKCSCFEGVGPYSEGMELHLPFEVK